MLLNGKFIAGLLSGNKKLIINKIFYNLWQNWPIISMIISTLFIFSF